MAGAPQGHEFNEQSSHPDALAYCGDLGVGVRSPAHLRRFILMGLYAGNPRGVR